MSILAVVGPRDAGPGERREMLEQAHAHLVDADSFVRVDVPGKGTASGDDGGGTMRTDLEAVVPALQSGSLFGGREAVMVVDAQNLLKAEAEIIAELLVDLPDGLQVAFTSTGALPAPLSRALKEAGEVVTIKKLRERDAGQWLASELKRRRLKLPAAAQQALIQRFGSDLAALTGALDQLELADELPSADELMERFRTRPDEPVWLYADAVSAGDVGQSLRRLTDFLTHSHPLVLLAYLENDLKRRAMAAAAPDLATFAEWSGTAPDHYPTKKAWGVRGRTSDSELRRALDAISRADQHLKSAPEDTHQLTMERLTVALCRWYSGSAARRTA
jgi:DNA polymerase III delta subunit